MAVEVRTPEDILFGNGLSGVCQVVLYNDNHNEITRVIAALVVIFRHTLPMAARIANEAHVRGRAVAEVEDVELAFAHRQMLLVAGLKAEVEKV